MAQRILRALEVRKRLGGIGKSTLRRMVVRGVFPPPVQVTELISGAQGWRESDVDAFIASRPNAVEWCIPRRAPAPAAPVAPAAEPAATEVKGS
jgi:predicted DNA-binding transcriptional regulator AlpA